eukprot:3023837-Prymnesium_polylepis.2
MDETARNRRILRTVERCRVLTKVGTPLDRAPSQRRHPRFRHDPSPVVQMVRPRAHKRTHTTA